MKRHSQDEIEIPKVTRFLSLQEFDPENAGLAGVGIFVWVDLPRSVLEEFADLNDKYAWALDKAVAKLDPIAEKTTIVDQRVRMQAWFRLIGKEAQPDGEFESATKAYRKARYAWYARLWSQTPDIETHWTADDLREIRVKKPRLFEWLCANSWMLIEQCQKDANKPNSGTVTQ